MPDFIAWPLLAAATAATPSVAPMASPSEWAGAEPWEVDLPEEDAPHILPVTGARLFAGLGNPEFAHLGLAYRSGNVEGAVSLGSLGTANRVDLRARGYLLPHVGAIFAEAGYGFLQLAKLSDQTPAETFQQPYFGVGWQFFERPSPWVFDVSLGLAPGGPETLAAAPGIINGSRLLPRFALEVGYAF